MKKRSVEERLIASMHQALEIARGERAPSRSYRLPRTARSTEAVEPATYDAARIARLRRELDLSQAVFADVLNVSRSTVRSWEQGIRVPEGAGVRLLSLLEENPSLATALLRERNMAVHALHERTAELHAASDFVQVRIPRALFDALRDQLHRSMEAADAESAEALVLTVLAQKVAETSTANAILPHVEQLLKSELNKATEAFAQRLNVSLLNLATTLRPDAGDTVTSGVLPNRNVIGERPAHDAFGRMSFLAD